MGLAHPRLQDFAQAIEHLAQRPFGRARQVNVFGITQTARQTP
jgi:hypothetical protein